MALYSNIDRRIWTDKKFCSFSDDTKLLWLYLLTCPETNSLPGVLVTGKANMYESLKWSPERFDIPFQVLSQARLIKADLEARLVWLRNALKYRAPANPNVVIGWNDIWDQVPECDLKDEVDKHFTAYFPSRGENFVIAWEQLPSRSANRSGNGMPNQEQEQEQEQEISVISDSTVKQIPGANRRAKPSPGSVLPEIINFEISDITFTAAQAFKRANYHGRDGAIFWKMSALAFAGKISEFEFHDTLDATAKSNNKPGYARGCFRRMLARRGTPIDADALLNSVRIKPECPTSAPLIPE